MENNEERDRIILMAVVGISIVGILLLTILIHSLLADEIEPYDRKDWLHWIDEDGDCLSTRDEVLIEESVSFVTVSGCKVVGGEWYDPYTGKTFTDPKLLDVDHVVPLKEAYYSGGWAWSKEQKRDYANNLFDKRHLIAVSAKANRSKGWKDPAKWLPTNKVYHCEYVQNWVHIKEIWGLKFDAIELTEIRKILDRSC